MSLPEGFTLRRATIDDLVTLVAHRQSMFRDMGYSDEAVLNSMSSRFREWLPERIKEGRYHAWVVRASDGSIAAGAALWLMDWIPHMIGQGSQRGNIVNVYTEEQFRRRGLARELVQAIVQWCRENRIDTIILHASPAGRSLYEELGFTASNEMRLQL
jgi:GNAT superfamily N-acetyltransferase